MACTNLDNMFNGALKALPKKTTFHVTVNTSQWGQPGGNGIQQDGKKPPPPPHLIPIGSGEGKLAYIPAHIVRLGEYVQLWVPAIFSGTVAYQSSVGSGEVGVQIVAPGLFGPSYTVTLHSQPGPLNGNFIPNCIGSILSGTVDELVVTITLSVQP